MEKTKEETADTDLQNAQRNNENFSWEEWSVIGEGEDGTIDPIAERSLERDRNSDTSEESFSDIDCTSEAEEAGECDCLSSSKKVTDEECLIEGNDSNILEKRNDESDGISVITESESDDAPRSKNNESRVVVYHEFIQRGTTERSRKSADTLYAKVGKHVYFAILCLLVSTIGMSTLFLLTNRGKPIVPREEFEEMTIEIINDYKLVPNEKKMTTFPDIPEVSAIENERFDSWEAMNFKGKSLINLLSPNDQLNALSQLQIFIDLLCSLMDNLSSSVDEKFNRMPICSSDTPMTMVFKLQRVLHTVLQKTGNLEKEKHQGFLSEIEYQMKESTAALVSDLSKALHNVHKKNKSKIKNIGKKMAKKLNNLRNNLPCNSEIREWLNRELFNEYCVPTFKYPTKDDSFQEKRGKNPMYQTRHKLNPWKTRKSYDEFRNFTLNHRYFDDSCSISESPKRSNLQKFCNSITNNAKNKEIKEKPDKNQSKGYRKAVKPLSPNKKVQNSAERKNGKKLRNDDIVSSKATEENKREEKEKSWSAEQRRQDFVSDTRDKRLRNHLYPSVLSTKRLEEKDEGTLKFFESQGSEKYAKYEKKDNWQFERSQGRNDLRKFKVSSSSSSNWYFDRAKRRNNARESHCTNENQDQRCINPLHL